jgi:hypothetical protein
LIAAAQSSGTKLDFLCKDSSDVGGLTQALELGVDALLVDAKAPAGLWEAVLRRKQKVVTLNVATWHALGTTPPIAPNGAGSHPVIQHIPKKVCAILFLMINLPELHVS